MAYNNTFRWSGKSGSRFIVFAVALAITFLVVPGIAAANTLTVTPRISLRYNFNDNIYGYSSEFTDDVGSDSASYLDYLIGAKITWRDGKNTFDLSGDLGYEQFIELGKFFDQFSTNPADFNSLTGGIGARYRYTGRIFTFTLADDFKSSRDLSAVFGMGTDAIGYSNLYTYNNALVGVGYNPTPRSRNSLSYTYDTLAFGAAEDFVLFRPSDSNEHRVLYRSEYDFSPKTTGIFDAQAADRTFADENTTDLRVYQSYLGVRFNLRERAYLEMLGGYAMRDLYNIPSNLDLEDTQDAIGRINFVSFQPKRYNFNVHVDRGVSLYGTNIFFVYNSVGASARIYATPKLSFNLAGSYAMDYFDLQRNDRENFWIDDRTDNIFEGKLGLQWDILEKQGEGTLTLEGGYSYLLRDSTLDAPSDYVNPANFWDYDATINSFYVQVQVKPTILFGNR